MLLTFHWKHRRISYPPDAPKSARTTCHVLVTVAHITISYRWLCACWLAACRKLEITLHERKNKTSWPNDQSWYDAEQCSPKFNSFELWISSISPKKLQVAISWITDRFWPYTFLNNHMLVEAQNIIECFVILKLWQTTLTNRFL